jgi:hypothetical protein
LNFSWSVALEIFIFLCREEHAACRARMMPLHGSRDLREELRRGDSTFYVRQVLQPWTLRRKALARNAGAVSFLNTRSTTKRWPP